MRRKIKASQKEEDLIRRYLIWCYKTTKENLDRLDRYFTQAKVDRVVLDFLKKTKEYKQIETINTYKQFIDEFEVYMEEKLNKALKRKFKDKEWTRLAPEYQYWCQRLSAIENAISYFLGKKELTPIHRLYEEEMIKRILQER